MHIVLCHAIAVTRMHALLTTTSQKAMNDGLAFILSTCISSLGTVSKGDMAEPMMSIYWIAYC
eukprot:scaffold167757_cov24-Prasinocladus_malaysianus.AAC.1